MVANLVPQLFLLGLILGVGDQFQVQDPARHSAR
jgi:hypothetical protein